MEKVYDVYCLGEILVDYFSSDYSLSLNKVKRFEGYFGGSVANVAVNLKREGKKPYLLAKIGKDREGQYLLEVLKKEKLENKVIVDQNAKTSRVFILKTKEPLPDSYYDKWNNYCRDADSKIKNDEINFGLFLKSKWFHTDAFSLVLNPIRETLFVLAQKAQKANIKVSFDLNFRQKNWSNAKKGKEIIKNFLKYVNLLKLSAEDAKEFLGKMKIEEYLQSLKNFGPSSIVITAGGKGVWYLDQEKIGFLKTKKISMIVSATGAGDDFQASLLASIIDGKALREAARIAIIKSCDALNYFGAIGEINGIKKPEINNNIF